MFLYRELLVLWNLILFQFKLIFPFWLAGVVTGSCISVFAARKIKDLAHKMNHEKYNLGTSFLAALLGVSSPICMYGTVPLIASLGKNGVPQYILATFMVSSILLNPNLLLLSFALGAPIAFIRLFVSMIAGLASGALVYVFYKRKSKPLFSFEGFEDKKECSSGAATIHRFFGDLNKAITITMPYLLTGILLTALFDRYFPKELLIHLFGYNKGLGVLLAASLGIPVYLCGGGTIPLIRVWLEAGMSIGSAVAFMVTGPATKLTNLGAVKIILGFKNFIFYLVFNILFAIIAGIVTDIIFGTYPL